MFIVPKLSSRRLRIAIFAFLAIGASIAAFVKPALAGRSDHWVVTTFIAPIYYSNDAAHDPGFENATVREVVTASIGGSKMRVRLTNKYGEQPIHIGAAHVAIRTQGDEITPNTDRVLTFNGSATVTIPVGDDIVSDPVSLDVPDQSALAISLFVPEATGKLRPHSGPPGRYTYVSTPGDFTGAQSISSAKRTDNFYWVKSIEVEAKKNVGTIVAIGSSVCAGAHSTEDAYNSWPGYLSRRILAAKKQPRMAVVNAGIGGNRIIFDGAGESLLHRLAPDALDLSGVKYVVMYAGNNDIGAQMSPQVTADAIIDGIRETAKRCHAKGIKFIALTFAPCITGPTFSDNSKSGGLSTQQKEAMRLAINNWIRTTKEIDGYADVETIADPDNPGAINPIYDSGDHLHPNDAGYEAMADAIPLNLFK